MILHNARSIDIHIDRCLNQRHFQAACDHCVRICPVGAITQDDRRVDIKREDCIGCGLCLQQCPAEVFATKKWDERFTLDILPQSGAGKVELLCANHSSTPIDGNSHIIQVPVCLGAMSKGIWFELGMKGEVFVRLDECQECPMLSAVSSIKNTVEYANEWLQACGYEANILCMEKINHTVQKSRRSAISAGEKRMSRRNFFLNFYNGAAKTISDAARNGSSRLEVDKRRNASPHIPKWMINLHRVYPGAAHKAAAPAYWPSIEVNKDCVTCDACTDYCPTGALTSASAEDHYSKYFIPGFCLDCRICVETCPSQAITRSQKPTSLPFQKQKVFESHIESCSRCGRAALSRNHKELCYWCAEEPSIDHLLHDVRRVLFSGDNSK